MSETHSGPENRLGREKSPYLLQHKHNPVDWYPWGGEAFARARSEDKPVLLSIGYAACHWCHVMAHESFENAATAALMNELFVNIKVDREERPDVDAVYMNALTLMGQHGGWPLTMFLTPKGEPFLGGTYFPPAPRHGHPGFPDVLKAVSRLYAEGRDRVGENVTAVADALKRMALVPEKRHAGLHSLSQLDALAQDALRIMDLEHGGTNGAPKFPQPSLLKFLWNAHLRTSEPTLGRAVTLSLTEMCQGGIYDHLGGGFARYATDERWLVPHFEKMLYDNAQLVELMTLVWSRTGEKLYETRIRETVDWVLRELATPDGAFAGTLDADSEGEEGKFYVWTEREVDEALGAEAPRFKAAYDVTPHGNWEGHTILNRSHELSLGNAAHEAVLKRGRDTLLARRAARVRPGLDDKILTDWNGLMIAALASASHVFGEPAWLAAAETAYGFIATRMQSEGRLRHSYRAGSFVARDVLDDYAQMSRAGLMLHQVTGAERYLDDARAWVTVADAHFWDASTNGSGGGYFFSADDAADLVARTRTAFDNATPSGNGTMAEVLARLYYLTGEVQYRDRADTIVDVFTRQPPEHYVNMPGILLGYEMLAAAVQVVVIGKPDDPDRTALARMAAASGVPTLVLAQIDAGRALPEGHAAHGKTMVENRATAYVCRGAVCGLPHTSPTALKAELARA